MYASDLMDRQEVGDSGGVGSARYGLGLGQDIADGTGNKCDRSERKSEAGRDGEKRRSMTYAREQNSHKVSLALGYRLEWHCDFSFSSMSTHHGPTTHKTALVDKDERRLEGTFTSTVCWRSSGGQGRTGSSGISLGDGCVPLSDCSGSWHTRRRGLYSEL